MGRFVLEIGTEELPSRFLASEEEAIAALFKDALNEAGLAFGEIKAFATPRRLALIIEDLADRQMNKEETISGPPVAISYDEAGNPTRALIGFLAGQNAELSDVFRFHTPKGEYVGVRKHEGGRSAEDVLAEICPRVIAKIPFAKRMRWGAHDFAYGRPIRWILALFDDKPVRFEAGPIASAMQTYGHRVAGPGPHKVNNAADYETTLKNIAQVVLDPQERKRVIREEGDRLAREAGGEVIWNDALLDEVAGLVEFPKPLLGKYDADYLEIPQEALLTSMETHQKSFGIRAKNGKLLPYFLTVLNLEPENLDLVRKGWERVLRARLEDARFFWRADTAASFDEWQKKLENVIFIGPLGSMAEKGKRLAQLCVWLAERVAPEISPDNAARAGILAKADLVSAMVGEFDTLQGVMGRIYAGEFGENEEVAKAIGEQYLPSGPDSPLPASIAGSILSIAGRADTLAGCFGLDKIPTGTADPFGLRRDCLGIIRILINRGWHIEISALFATAREHYGERQWKLSPADALAKLMEFYRARLRNYLISSGYDTIQVDAVMAAGADDPVNVKARLDALAAFAASPAWVPSAQILKRIDNITKKETDAEAVWQDSQLAEKAEKELAEVLRKEIPVIDKYIENEEYAQALQMLDKLRSSVDSFFENVMVLCDDADLRANRVGLLKFLAKPYLKIAKFANLQI